jgi:serine/threonine-protein kinase
MAPEMATNGTIDGRTDLYALGCVAYWLLTGQLVFRGETGLAVLMKHANESPVPPSRWCEEPLEPELEQLVLDCLAKDPDARPASALELDRRLAGIEARIGAWTPERAEQWWRARLPHLAITSGSGSVAVATT